MENREALLNAGFRGNFSPVGKLTTSKYLIYADKNTLDLKIVTKDHIHILDAKPRTLEELKQVCLGFADLDFTAKPRYDWETVFDKFPVYNHNKVINTEIAINVLAKEGIISKLEALSMIAKLKLNIIIRQIDKDYPPIPTETVMGGIKYQDGELQAHYFQDDYSSRNSTNSKVVIATLEGAKILLDQNPQLLQNLFKIETDA